MGDHDLEVPERLDHLFYIFAQIILVRVKSFMKFIGGIPVEVRYYVSFDEGSSVRITQINNDYNGLLMHYIVTEQPWTLTEFEKCAKALWDQGILRQPVYPGPPPLFEDIKISLIHQLFLPIRDVIERYHTLDPTQEQLMESYHRYKDDWIAPLKRYEVTIPVLNFISELQKEVTIGKHLVLAPFTPEEKTLTWNSEVDLYPSVTNPIEHGAFLRSKYKLAQTRLQDQTKRYGVEEINGELADVLTALRLTKTGDIGAPAIFERSEIRSIWLPSPTVTRTSDYDVRQSGTEYSITEAELSQVNNLFVSLQDLNSQAQRGGLTVALRRFNQAYSRENDEDRIIDLTIALESCLLAGLSKELSYRFVLRGAALVADSRNPKETKALLQEIYDIRSSIVHDGKTLPELKKDTKHDPPGHAAKEFLQQSEELVRDILGEYVTQIASSNQPVKKFNEQLELRIVKSLSLS